MLLVASCYRNRDKLRPDRPLGSHADFTWKLNLLETRTVRQKSMRVNDKNNFVAVKFCSLQNE